MDYPQQAKIKSSGRVVPILDDGGSFCVVRCGGVGFYSPDDGSLQGGLVVSGPYPRDDPRFERLPEETHDSDR